MTGWVSFICFLPHFLESLKAPILSERSRPRLNNISNIKTNQRLKWISHNIRSNELFALYKCIPPPLPASWSHLLKPSLRYGCLFVTLRCRILYILRVLDIIYIEGARYYIDVIVLFLPLICFSGYFLFDFCLLPWYVFEDASWPVANLEQRSQLSGTDLYVSTWGKTSDELQSQQGRLL